MATYQCSVWCPDTRIPRCNRRTDDGHCSCLSDTSFSSSRKDEYGQINCPFYRSCMEEESQAMRCRRFSCVYQTKMKGFCSSTEMFEDCPWKRRNTNPHRCDAIAEEAAS